jgi:hypothetical protein
VKLAGSGTTSHTAGDGPDHDLFWGLIREISQLRDNITHVRTDIYSRKIVGFHRNESEFGKDLALRVINSG